VWSAVGEGEGQLLATSPQHRVQSTKGFHYSSQASTQMTGKSLDKHRVQLFNWNLAIYQYLGQHLHVNPIVMQFVIEA
jgi:hypothetical protein